MRRMQQRPLRCACSPLLHTDPRLHSPAAKCGARRRLQCAPVPAPPEPPPRLTCACHPQTHPPNQGRFVINDDTRPPRIRAAQGHSVPLPAPVLDPVTDAASVPPAVHVTSEDGCAAAAAGASAPRGRGRSRKGCSATSSGGAPSLAKCRATARERGQQRRAGRAPRSPLPASLRCAFPSTSPARLSRAPRRWASIQECGELRRMKRTHVHFATRPDHERANDWATAQLLLDLRGAMAAGLEFAM